MASNQNFHRKAPKFNFNSHWQLEDWKVFYTRAIDYLVALNIDDDEADDHKMGWKQLKMMFKDKGRHILQSLMKNDTMLLESQGITQLVLDATGTTITSEEHFWHFWDEL